MKKLITLILALAVLLQSAGQSHALRPMAGLRSGGMPPIKQEKPNKYYLISAAWPDLRPLYDNLPKVVSDKVVACVTPSFLYAIMPEFGGAKSSLLDKREEHKKIEQIIAYFREHISKAKEAGAVPILLGGPHIASYWFYIALKQVHGTLDIDILSLDMDTDTMTFKLNECGFWAYGMKNGVIPPERLTVVGIGDTVHHEATDWARKKGTVYSESSIPDNRQYENVFVSLDVDVYYRLEPKVLQQELACKLQNSNILGLHIGTLESFYIEGLRDSELDIVAGLFPQAFVETTSVETTWIQPIATLFDKCKQIAISSSA